MIFKHITDIIVDWGDQFILLIDNYSFNTCLLVGLVALILYIFGYDKGKKLATLSPAVYIVIQIFLKAWFGV